MSQTIFGKYIQGEDPLLSIRVRDRKTGANQDLTGVTIGIKSWFQGESSLIIDGAGTLDADPSTGLFSYQVLDTEFDRVGRHYMEFKLTFPGGEVRKGKVVVEIEPGAPA